MAALARKAETGEAGGEAEGAAGVAAVERAALGLGARAMEDEGTGVGGVARVGETGSHSKHNTFLSLQGLTMPAVAQRQKPPG